MAVRRDPGEQYRLIFLSNIFKINLKDHSTQQYCYVEFPFKLFDNMVNKRFFFKLLTCSVQQGDNTCEVF